MEKAKQSKAIVCNEKGLDPELVITRAYELPDMVFLPFFDLFPEIEEKDIQTEMAKLIKSLPPYIAIIDDLETLPNAKCGGIAFKRAYESNPTGLVAIIHNYAILGEPCADYSKKIPTFVNYWLQADLWDKDEGYMDYAFTSKYAISTLELVKKLTNVDYIVAFDGITDGINVSKTLANYLLKK